MPWWNTTPWWSYYRALISSCRRNSCRVRLTIHMGISLVPVGRSYVYRRWRLSQTSNFGRRPDWWLLIRLEFRSVCQWHIDLRVSRILYSYLALEIDSRHPLVVRIPPPKGVEVDALQLTYERSQHPVNPIRFISTVDKTILYSERTAGHALLTLPLAWRVG